MYCYLHIRYLGDRSIYAHVNSSWLHVADLPQGLKVPSLIPLPSDELAVVGESKVAGVSKLCMYMVSFEGTYNIVHSLLSHLSLLSPL